MARLGKFEGKDVRGSAVVIKRAGDGLSKELRINPEVIPDGATVYFVLKGEVDHVSFPKVDKASKDKIRRHTVNTIEVTRVEAEDVEPFLEAARRRIAEAEEAERLAEEKAAGVQRLPVGDAE